MFNLNNINIAFGDSVNSALHNKNTSWNDFCEMFRTPKILDITFEEYKSMNKEARRKAKDIGCYLAGTVDNGSNKKENVLNRTLLTLDADSVPAGVDFKAVVHEQLKGVAYVLGTSFSHGLDGKGKYRLVVLPDRELSQPEYEQISSMMAVSIGIEYFDKTSFNPAQKMFLPAHTKDGVYEAFVSSDNDPLCVDAYLADAKTQEIIQASINRSDKADPITRPNIEGVFCRTYSIYEAIEKFLQDIYAATDDPTRYTYTEGSSEKGLFIIDDKFAFSHHGTDPASNIACNAFELVMLHKFGKGEKAYQKMCKFANNDSRVLIKQAEEKTSNYIQLKTAMNSSSGSQAPSNAWIIQLRQSLSRDPKTGEIKNALVNVEQIFAYDQNLRGIAFNRFVGRIEVTGELLWEKPDIFWNDTDTAELTSYLANNYAEFNTDRIRNALICAANSRSFHPVQDYLNGLPEWDGVERVDTLLIDYLGADDNVYVREAMRKQLIAAVRRAFAYKTGYKHDYILSLNGAQSEGKSTIIKKLAGDWFTDSISFSDIAAGDRKIAAEKIQGVWLVEFGEMSGLRKAEVESVKNFISAEKDTYREAYGRNSSDHIRQCVFFATTNAENGYLRDTTGNRRFWHIKLHKGKKVKNSWDITPEERDQIWAEVMVYHKAGESTLLSAEAQEIAEKEQRNAMEADEREGLVIEYLETPLPDEDVWDGKTLEERRRYLAGDYDSEDKRISKRHRTAVSTMEVWCECFCNDSSKMTRKDSNAIVAMLKKCGCKTEEGRQRIKIYGQQRMFSVPEQIIV